MKGNWRVGTLDYYCQSTWIGTLPLQKASVVDSMSTLEQSVGHLIDNQIVLVVDHACPLAILTIEDLVQQVGQFREGEQTPVIEIASRIVICCQSQTSIQEAFDLMSRKKVQNIVVYEGEKLLGVINSKVILSYFLSVCRKNESDKVDSGHLCIEELIQ